MACLSISCRFLACLLSITLNQGKSRHSTAGWLSLLQCLRGEDPTALIIYFSIKSILGFAGEMPAPSDHLQCRKKWKKMKNKGRYGTSPLLGLGIGIVGIAIVLKKKRVNT